MPLKNNANDNFNFLSSLFPHSFQAIFFAVLEEEAYCYDPDDDSKLNTYAMAMFAGRCYDRWFDKSFTMVFAKNGRVSLRLREFSQDDALPARFQRERDLKTLKNPFQTLIAVFGFLQETSLFFFTAFSSLF